VTPPAKKKTFKQTMHGLVHKILHWEAMILLTLVYVTAFGLTALFFLAFSPYCRTLRRRPASLWLAREEQSFDPDSLKFQF
jgi:hypothetical protein